MNKNLYPWLVLFLGLTAASILLQSILSLLLGIRLYKLDSFNIWVLITNITVVIRSLLLLWYYYFKKYRLPFFTGAFYTVCILCYSIVVYASLNFGKLGNYGMPLLFITTCAGVIYGVSLASLRIKDAGWLSSAGAYMLVLGLIILFALVRMAIYPHNQLNSANESLLQWVSFASFLVPVLFMMHFLKETRKPVTIGTNAPAHKPIRNMAKAAGITLLGLTLIIGTALASECYSAIYWSKWGLQKTQALTRIFESGIFENRKGDTLHYRLLKPLDYSPAKR